MNTLIGRLNDNVIKEFWRAKTILELFPLKRIKIINSTQIMTFGSMTFDDLYLVICIYGLLMFAAVFISTFDLSCQTRFSNFENFSTAVKLISSSRAAYKNSDN